MKAIGEQELHGIIGRVYESVAEPAALQDVLRSLADAFDAHSAVLFTPALPPERGGLFVLHNHDHAAIQRYREHYFDLDLWWHTARERSVDGNLGVVTGAELVDRRVFECSEFYNDFLKPMDTYHVIATDIRVRPGPQPLDVSLAFHGSPRHSGFGDEEKTVLETIVPHLRRALQLCSRLAGTLDGVRFALDVLETLADGVLLLGENGAVLYATESARSRLNASSGLRLCNGRLSAWRARDNAELASLIARAAEADGPPTVGTVAVCCPHADQPLIVSVFPLSRRSAPLSDAESARVLVTLRDPTQPRAVCWDSVAHYFSITPAELRLCRALADDVTLPEYCVRNQISDATARSQLRSVFGKTGVRRQSELLHLFSAFT